MSVLNGSSAIGFLAADAATPTGYSISRSARFSRSDSSYLNRTPASTSNRKTFTLSLWAKLGNLNTGVDSFLWSSADGAGNTNAINLLWKTFDGTCRLILDSAVNGQLRTTAVYRDPSAWMHIVISVDTTQATAANRTRMYVNGVQITAFDTANYPSQNLDYDINTPSFPAFIGCLNVSGPVRFFDGYLADIHFIDGQALTPTSFGAFDTNGVWQPAQYTGTYGTNGYRLPFSNNATPATLGTDASGNNNTFDVFNFATSNFTIASASGGLPLYNTSDPYGRTRSAGLRTDANASFLSLATALGTEAGLDLTDQNVSGRTSGLKTITGAGTVTSSSSFNFYGGSVRFTGASNSYASVSSSSDFTFGTGDFTIELWVKSEATDVNPSFFRRFITIGPDGTDSVQLGHIVNTTGRVVYYTNTQTLVSTSVITNKWTHVALTRASGTVRLFINGTLEASATDTNNKTGTTPSIGAYNNSNDGRMQGDMQDLRIYKGLAKYTASFVPPSLHLATTNDSLVDTPTNGSQTDTGVGGEVVGNYCTWNPVASGSGATLTNGNLDYTLTGATTSVRQTRGTFLIPTSGKWYWECTVTVLGETVIGVVDFQTELASTYYWYTVGGFLNIIINGVQTAAVTGYAAGDIIGVGYDADNQQIRWYKNGTQVGTNYSLANTGRLVPFVEHGSSGGSCAGSTNFGARPFAYTAPSGFKALCTANLPTPTITKGDTAMVATLYTGNGGTQAISGLSFSPDLVWIKSRTSPSTYTFNHLRDTIRGATRPVYSNDTLPEGTDSAFASFDATGFTVNADLGQSAVPYASWCWDAGSSTVSNSAGSRTSQVRANPSTGFSIATWSGSGSGGVTVGHGLNIAPAVYFVKDRNNTRNWLVYHTSIGATGGTQLNLANAGTTGDINYWNNTAPTSTVASMGAYANEASNYVGYFWAPVAGYSAFGNWTAAAAPVFIYTGFRPAFLLGKSFNTSNDWWIRDNKRFGYNPNQYTLFPNNPISERNDFMDTIDFVSNGFVIRASSTTNFTNQGNMIYMAFAENPFRIARAG